MSFTLFIQTNSPGEVSAWVHPIAEAFSKACPLGTIQVFLTPCQYASGQESSQLSTYPNVCQVHSPSETIKFIFSLPFRKKHAGPGAVLYLGGDPLYARLLGFKLDLPVYGYTERKDTHWWGFKHLFTKAHDGDLMSAHIAQFIQNPPSIQNPTDILIFTGSRPQHTQHLLPFLVQVAQEITTLAPQIALKLSISPFISTELVTKLVPADILDTHIIRDQNSLALTSQTKLLVTIPGTSTAEAAYLHTPTLVILPLNQPQALIFDGLAGLLAKTPILGPAIITLIIAILKRQKRFYALPNRITNQNIIPEIIGILDPKKLAKDILELYHNPEKRSQIQDQLKTYFQPSHKIAEEIILAILS